MILEGSLSLAMCGRVLVFLKRGHEMRFVKVEPRLRYPQLPRTVVGVNWPQPEPTRHIGCTSDGKGDEMEFPKPVGVKSWVSLSSKALNYRIRFMVLGVGLCFDDCHCALLLPSWHKKCVIVGGRFSFFFILLDPTIKRLGISCERNIGLLNCWMSFKEWSF